MDPPSKPAADSEDGHGSRSNGAPLSEGQSQSDSASMSLPLSLPHARPSQPHDHDQPSPSTPTPTVHPEIIVDQPTPTQQVQDGMTSPLVCDECGEVLPAPSLSPSQSTTDNVGQSSATQPSDILAAHKSSQSHYTRMIEQLKGQITSLQQALTRSSPLSASPSIATLAVPQPSFNGKVTSLPSFVLPAAPRESCSSPSLPSIPSSSSSSSSSTSSSSANHSHHQSSISPTQLRRRYPELTPLLNTRDRHLYQQEKQTPASEKQVSEESWTSKLLQSKDAADTVALEGSDLHLLTAARVYLSDTNFCRVTLHSTSLAALRAYEWIHQSWWKALLRWAGFLHLLLGVFEPPSSITYNGHRLTQPNHAICGAIELVFLALYAYQMMMQYRAYGAGPHGYSRSVWRRLKVPILLLCFIDVIVSMARNSSTPAVHASQILRVYFVLQQSGRCRHLMSCILRALPQLFSILFLMTLHLCVFGLAAFLFIGPLETAEHGMKLYFDELTTSFKSLLITLTSANFPSVMIPAYRNHWWVAIFFVAYITLGLFLLTQLTTALMFAHFAKHTKTQMKRRMKRKARAMQMAFALLAMWSKQKEEQSGDHQGTKSQEKEREKQIQLSVEHSHHHHHHHHRHSSHAPHHSHPVTISLAVWREWIAFARSDWSPIHADILFSTATGVDVRAMAASSLDAKGGSSSNSNSTGAVTDNSTALGMTFAQFERAVPFVQRRFHFMPALPRHAPFNRYATTSMLPTSASDTATRSGNGADAVWDSYHRIRSHHEPIHLAQSTLSSQHQLDQVAAESRGTASLLDSQYGSMTQRSHTGAPRSSMRYASVPHIRRRRTVRAGSDASARSRRHMADRSSATSSSRSNWLVRTLRSYFNYRAAIPSWMLRLSQHSMFRCRTSSQRSREHGNADDDDNHHDESHNEKREKEDEDVDSEDEELEQLARETEIEMSGRVVKTHPSSVDEHSANDSEEDPPPVPIRSSPSSTAPWSRPPLPAILRRALRVPTFSLSEFVSDSLTVAHAVLLLLSMTIGSWDTDGEGIPDRWTSVAQIMEAIVVLVQAVFTFEMIGKFIAYTHTAPAATRKGNSSSSWFDRFKQRHAPFFSSSLRNFDLLCLVIIWTAQILIWTGVHRGRRVGGSGELDALSCIRLCRLFRMYHRLSSFTLLLRVVKQVGPALVALLGVLVLLMYCYAIIGMACFMHATDRDRMPDPSTPDLLLDYVKNGFFPMNFNDFAHAFIVMFHQLVVNDWWVTADGFAYTLGDASRLFFISFYACGTLIVLAVCTAFITEAYIEMATTHDQEKSKKKTEQRQEQVEQQQQQQQQQQRQQQPQPQKPLLYGSSSPRPPMSSRAPAPSPSPPPHGVYSPSSRVAVLSLDPFLPPRSSLLPSMSVLSESAFLARLGSVSAKVGWKTQMEPEHGMMSALTALFGRQQAKRQEVTFEEEEGEGEEDDDDEQYSGEDGDEEEEKESENTVERQHVNTSGMQ